MTGRYWPYLGRGVVANALNPKVGLFFLTFLPQFLDPSQPVAPQAAVRGVLFRLAAILLFSVLGYVAGVVGEWIKRRPGIGQWRTGQLGACLSGWPGTWPSRGDGHSHVA